MKGYRITNNVDEMNLQAIHGFLANSCWSKGIPVATLQRAMENSLCFGVLSDTNEQIAFARMVTDRATYAYLADVFVVESHRDKGIAKWLLQNVLAHPDLQGLRRMMLATRDAHGLYKQFDFKPLVRPEMFMEVWKPDVYQSDATP